MKKALILFLIINCSLLINNSLKAQTTDIIYLDEQGNETKEKKATYKVIKEKDNRGKLNGYTKYYSFADTSWFMVEYYIEDVYIAQIILDKELFNFDIDNQTPQRNIELF